MSLPFPTKVTFVLFKSIAHGVGLSVSIRGKFIYGSCANQPKADDVICLRGICGYTTHIQMLKTWDRSAHHLWEMNHAINVFVEKNGNDNTLRTRLTVAMCQMVSKILLDMIEIMSPSDISKIRSVIAQTNTEYMTPEGIVSFAKLYAEMASSYAYDHGICVSTIPKIRSDSDLRILSDFLTSRNEDVETWYRDILSWKTPKSKFLRCMTTLCVYGASDSMIHTFLSGLSVGLWMRLMTSSNDVTDKVLVALSSYNKTMRRRIIVRAIRRIPVVQPVCSTPRRVVVVTV